MPRLARLLVALFAATAFITCSGCANGDRSVVQLEVPRIYVHTHYDSDELRRLIDTDGPSVAFSPDSGIVVQGTGALSWPAVKMTVRQDGIMINGVDVTSRPEGQAYRNVTVSKEGKVDVDRFLPFERPVYKLW